METEAEYLLRRASEEARRALGADKPEAADIHSALSVRYSAKAVTLLMEEDDGAAASAGETLTSRQPEGSDRR
jgi:hypothetical protein